MLTRYKMYFKKRHRPHGRYTIKKLVMAGGMLSDRLLLDWEALQSNDIDADIRAIILLHSRCLKSDAAASAHERVNTRHVLISTVAVAAAATAPSSSISSSSSSSSTSTSAATSSAAAPATVSCSKRHLLESLGDAGIDELVTALAATDPAAASSMS